VGGLTELNKQTENIILVEKRNIEDFASKILYLSDNAEFRKQLGEKAFQKIRQLIKPDEIVHDILKAYEQITMGTL
jgi:glycosyltransferase involved in cell wall biosynthesis